MRAKDSSLLKPHESQTTDHTVRYVHRHRPSTLSRARVSSYHPKGPSTQPVPLCPLPLPLLRHKKAPCFEVTSLLGTYFLMRKTQRSPWRMHRNGISFNRIPPGLRLLTPLPIFGYESVLTLLPFSKHLSSLSFLYY